MLKTYRTINQSMETMIVEKKSKFIGFLIPVTTEEEAKAQLETIKKTHYNASHHCSAYRIGLSDQVLERYSDDGEPSGTAGMPMLEVLRGLDLRQAMVVVVRYFGGTKLGTGGLVRAYTEATQAVISESKLITKLLGTLLSISVDYNLSGKLEYLIHQKDYYIKETTYDTGVTYTVLVPDLEIFQNEVIELSGGKAVMETLGAYYVYQEDNAFILEAYNE